MTTVDNADVGRSRGALADAPGAAVAGEAERWQEAGYWLTPLIALLGAGCGSAAAGCVAT